LHRTTTIDHHFLHVFSRNYRRFGPESACETGRQTETSPKKAEDSPQLTTKTEDWFYPHRNGLATPIDICPAGRPHRATELVMKSDAKAPAS
jgi:hypothetical protein